MQKETFRALLLTAQGRLRSGWRVVMFAVLSAGFALPLGGVVAALGLRTEIGFWIAVVIALLASHAVMLVLVDRRSWRDVGLSRHDARPVPVAGAFAIGTFAIAVPCAVLIAAGWLRIVPDGGGGGAAASVQLALLLVPAALAEELAMRGYLLSALSDGVGTAAAILLTSFLFALLHWQNPGVTAGSLTVVTLAGIFLGVVRVASGSLYAAWAAHLAWNLVLGVALHAAVSGQDLPSPWWRTIDTGPDWATGGPWGPEGGVPAAVGLGAATWYLLARPSRAARANVRHWFARPTREERAG